MPIPPKDKVEPKKPDAPETWADDQQTREYYYDDAHGYETYDPGEEESDETDEAKTEEE